MNLEQHEVNQAAHCTRGMKKSKAGRRCLHINDNNWNDRETDGRQAEYEEKGEPVEGRMQKAEGKERIRLKRRNASVRMMSYCLPDCDLLMKPFTSLFG